MRTDELDFDLPDELIAQEPAAQRRDSRLLVVDRSNDAIGHHAFTDLPSFLRAGDLLVVNDTRVIRARLVAKRPTGGVVEVFLLSKVAGGGDDETWEALARPSKRLREGDSFRFGKSLDVALGERLGDGRWSVRLLSTGGLSVAAAVEETGRIPLPPYIRRSDDDARSYLDAVRYQTVFASDPGSVAAPTAGLHFDEAMFEELKGQGVGVAKVTLSVGIGTFRQVGTEVVEDYEIHPEAYHLSAEAADLVNATKMAGGRIVAVGTTSVRTLESCAGDDGRVAAGEGTTRLFVTPGYRFKAVDAMVTNFHLPRSSLLALVMAFGGTDLVKRAYREAVERRYRFFSYGDAMLLL